MEEQERLQQQVDGYKRELAQRVERIQRLEATRDDLLEQVTFQQLQLKQNRQDIQCEVKLREEAETLKKTLERRNADQKNEISELKAMISRLQQEPMVGVFTWRGSFKRAVCLFADRAAAHGCDVYLC